MNPELTPRGQIALWLDNLDIAQTMMEGVAPSKVDLGLWRTDEAGNSDVCGSVFCFGGFCAIEPAFRAQGVSAGQGGAPWLTALPEHMQSPYDVANFLFGDETLFRSRQFVETGTDKDVVLSRIGKRLIRLQDEYELEAS